TSVQLAKILFIPNSIKVFLTYETYFFASFLHRDDAYRLLTKMSRGESIAHLAGGGGGGGAREGEEGESGEEGAAADGSDDDRPAARTGSLSRARSPPLP